MSAPELVLGRRDDGQVVIVGEPPKVITVSGGFLALNSVEPWLEVQQDCAYCREITGIVVCGVQYYKTSQDDDLDMLTMERA